MFYQKLKLLHALPLLQKKKNNYVTKVVWILFSLNPSAKLMSKIFLNSTIFNELPNKLLILNLSHEVIH